MKDDLNEIDEAQLEPGNLLCGKVIGLYNSKYRVVLIDDETNENEDSVTEVPKIGDYVDFVVERKTSSKNWIGTINKKYSGRIDKKKTAYIPIDKYTNKTLRLKVIDLNNETYILDFDPCDIK